MKKLLLLPAVFLLYSIGLQAQIGLSFGYVNMDTPKWNDHVTASTIFTDDYTLIGENGFQYGIDYWFRLKNKRIEFLPELSHYQLSGKVASEILPDNAFSVDMIANIFQLHFNTQIYPFDFEGDCDCPTFSKDGDVFKKGLFIRIAPGLSYGTFKQERSDVTIAGENTVVTKELGITPTLRAGVGLDIGVSDFFTITPLVQYTHTMPTGGFPILGEGDSSDLLLSEITQLYFGIRLGFRFDELNKYGYR